MRRIPTTIVALLVTGSTLACAPAASAGALPSPQPPNWSRVAAIQSTSHGDQGLAAKVDATLTTSSVAAARVGVVVRDMTTGHLVEVRNPSMPLSPASTAKVRTTSAALALLGPGYTWRTEVRARGTVTDGVLDGPLVLKGYGDPTLLASDLADLARQVRAAGITSVSGLVTDATWFDAQRHNPGWKAGWSTEYWAAPISALTLAPNTDYDASTAIVSYAPGTVGGLAKVSTVPAAAAKYLTVRNLATTSAAGTGDRVSIAQAADSATVTVSGSVAAGRGTASVWKVTPSPQLYAGTVFREALAAAGVTVTGSMTPGAATASDRVLATHRSQPLSSAIVPLLKLSNNMMAEHLLKTISAQAGGGGTWPDGAARIRSWMTSVGVPMQNVTIVDGSGLSPSNKETPMSESQILWLQRANTVLRAALPLAGNPDRMVGGTLRNRFVGTAAANNLQAKTGTLDGVTGLTGYVRSANGRALSMSMLSAYSGTSTRPVENSLGAALASWNGARSATTPFTTTSTPSGATGEWTKRTS